MPILSGYFGRRAGGVADAVACTDDGACDRPCDGACDWTDAADAGDAAWV